jgi:hypothetical protein
VGARQQHVDRAVEALKARAVRRARRKLTGAPCPSTLLGTRGGRCARRVCAGAAIILTKFGIDHDLVRVSINNDLIISAVYADRRPVSVGSFDLTKFAFDLNLVR